MKVRLSWNNNIKILGIYINHQTLTSQIHVINQTSDNTTLTLFNRTELSLWFGHLESVFWVAMMEGCLVVEEMLGFPGAQTERHPVKDKSGHKPMYKKYNN